MYGTMGFEYEENKIEGILWKKIISIVNYCIFDSSI